MSAAVEQALKFWSLEAASYELIANRENQVFRVDLDGDSFALRLHRRGYRSDTELWSELLWMNAVSQGGLHVPTPIISTSGEYLHRVGDIQVDMLSWLSGTPCGSISEGLQVEDRVGLMRNIGCEMARLHQISDEWPRPSDFVRPAWDRWGLVGECPVWGCFWENPTLSKQDRDLLQAVRGIAQDELAHLELKMDIGLIHADLVRENILVDGNTLQFIDFDDGGFGFRLFDLATVLMPNLYEQDFPALKDAVLEGYRSERKIDTAHLDLFMLLRSASYVGWIITRMEEDGAGVRNDRFIDRTRMLAEGYLS